MECPFEALTAAKRQVGHLINYKRNVKDLQEQLELLRLRRGSIQDKVDVGRRNGEVILNEALQWLEEVSKIIAEAEEFQLEQRLAEAKFCNSPSLCQRLSKRTKNTTSIAIRFLENNDILSSISQPINFLETSEDFLDFESRTTIFQEMMEALHDDNINVIGVYGLAGVGKTELVKQAANLAIKNRFFDAVVMVVVTHIPNVCRIQREIAKVLGLQLSEESLAQRAARIRQRLEKEKKVLIILDDVWERLDLVDIGIPGTNDRVLVKVVVVSRSLDALQQMEAQKNFGIKRLTENEGFTLFRKISGIFDSNDYHYEELAVEISNICADLPVVLITVARALRNKSLNEWKDTIRHLQAVEINGDDSVRDHVSRKLSFDRLEGDEVKLTLLLCSALGEEIFLEQLVKLGFAWGLFKHIETVEEARHVMDNWIRILVSYNLLLLLKDGKIIMHQLLRDVALQIASKEYHVFLVQDGIEDTKWPDDENLIQNFTSIFLLGKHKGELPERLVCSKLELLHVYDESQTLAIPDHLFEGINKGLQVLSLNNMKLPSLPSSICVLTSIQTLCLEKCELQDIALIGKLITLKVLSLSGSNIKQLPYQIRYLINLWLLDLDNCSKLEMIPYNVISNLTRLQELLLPNSFGNWQHSEGSNDERTSDASLGELSYLNDINALQIHIPVTKIVPRDFPWLKLERYNIYIGQAQGWWSSQFERKLQLNLGTNIAVYDWVKPLLVKSQELWLKELKGFKSLLELDHQGFHELKHLHIQDIAEMEWLVNSVHPFSFHMLELLVLNNLMGLKGLCYSQPSIVISFDELQVVRVERCEKLEFVFSSSLCRGLKKLRELEISTCRNLGTIVGGNKDGQASGIIQFPQLRSMTLQNLAHLVGFMSEDITQETKDYSPFGVKYEKFKMEQLQAFMDTDGRLGIYQKWKGNLCFDDEKVLFTNLEKLNLHGLRHFTSLYNHHGHSLEMLNSLALSECHNLKYLFSSQAAKALCHLQELRITACKSINVIVMAELGPGVDKIELPEVRTLILENLANLTTFCSYGCSVEWQSLNKLIVVRCPNIRQGALGFVDKSKLDEVRGDVNTRYWEDDFENITNYLFMLTVVDPYENQKILDIEGNAKLVELMSQLQTSSFRKLTNLSASKCNDGLLTYVLTKLIPRSRELQLLELKDCKSMREVFNFEGLSVDERGHGKFLDQLKTIKLWDLPDLSCIWNEDPTDILDLHNLEEMEIVNCGFLETLIPTSLAQHLQQLKVLKIHSCPTIEVFHMNTVDETGKTDIVLPELQTLELVLLQKFKRLHAPNCPFQFPSMESLTIEDCPTMDAFTSGFLNTQSQPAMEGKSEEGIHEDMAVYKKMKNLKLKGLQNIEDIWQDSISPGSFSELEEVELNGFGKLKYLIPSNMLPMLKDLKKLTVKNCDLLTEVFRLDEQFEFVSSVLTKPSILVLTSLRNLLHIFEFRSSRIFENLQFLQIKRCDSLLNLVFPSICIQKLIDLEVSECKILKEINVTENGSEIEEKFLFSKLDRVVLEELPKLSTFFPRDTVEFPSTVTISIINCPELKKFPSGSYVKNSFQMLEKFTVQGCKALELAFDIDKHDCSNEGFLPRLKELVLTDLPIMFLWRQEPRVAIFKNLKFLEVVHCSSLETLFSISIAKNLLQLELLKLYGCEKMEHVLKGEARSARVVEFKSLKCLILKHLPMLRSFCEEDCYFRWPELEMVRVSNIPKMETFAKRRQETPKLEKFYITYVSNCWQGDLNKTIKYLHDNPGGESAGTVVKKTHFSPDLPMKQ